MATRTSTKAAVTSQQIAEKAYERFLSRGAEHGHDIEDWLAAEAEVKPPAKRNGSKPRTRAAAKA